MGSLTTSNLPASTAVQIFGISVWDENVLEENWDLTTRSMARRSVLIGWNDIPAFVQFALTPIPINSVANGQYPPYWAYPRAPWMRIKNVHVQEMIPTQGGLTQLTYNTPQGVVTTLVAGNYGRCVITYGPMDWQTFDAGDLEYNFGLEAIKLPSSCPTFSYKSNDSTASSNQWVNVADSPPIEIPVGQITYTFKNQASIPISTILAALAAPVNSDTFPLQSGGSNIGVTMAAGTVKFLGLGSHYQVQGTGSAMWTYQLRFGYKSVGWNKAIQPLTIGGAALMPNWVPIYWIASSSPPYATSALTPLIQ